MEQLTRNGVAKAFPLLKPWVYSDVANLILRFHALCGASLRVCDNFGGLVLILPNRHWGTTLPFELRRIYYVG